MALRERHNESSKKNWQGVEDITQGDINRLLESMRTKGELSHEEHTKLEVYGEFLEDQNSGKADHEQAKGSSSDMTKISRGEYAILKVAGLKRFIKMRYPNDRWSPILKTAELFPTELEEVETMLRNPEDHNLHNPPTKGDIYAAFKIIVEKEAQIHNDHNCDCWQAWYCCNKNSCRLTRIVRIKT